VSKKKILIIKGTKSSGQDVSELLEQYGYEVVSVKAPSEVGWSDDDIDLLVADLPEKEPGEAEAALKKGLGSGMGHIPVLALALPGQMDVIDRLLESGCEDYLLKPIDPRLLFHRVQSLIESYPRTYRRAKCSIVTEVSTGQNNLTGEMVEIGEGGFSVILPEQLQMKDLVTVAFVLPGDDTQYVAAALVVYMKDNEDGYLHGMQFEILDEKARENINFFVACQ